MVSDFARQAIDAQAKLRAQQIERENAEARRAASNDLMQALEQDARVIREARMPAKGPVPAEKITEIRESLRRIMEEQGHSITVIARKMGYSNSVLSQWLADKYEGDVDEVTRKVAGVIESLRRGEEPGLPRGFIRTSQVNKIFGLASAAKSTSSIALYVGGSGTSKTMCAKAICAGAVPSIPLAHHIQLKSDPTKPTELLEIVAKAVKSRPQTGTRGRLLDGIIDTIKGRDALLIIDDAQLLHRQCDQVLIALCKLGECPMLIFDTARFDSRASDESRWDGQLARLFISRWNAIEEHERDDGRPLFTIEEIVRFAQGSGVRLTGSAAEWLTHLACLRGVGGLGRVSKIIYLAKMTAKAQGREAIDKADVDKAWVHICGLQSAQATMLREEKRRRVKTA